MENNKGLIVYGQTMYGESGETMYNEISNKLRNVARFWNIEKQVGITKHLHFL